MSERRSFSLGEAIDRAISPFAPVTAAKRTAARIGLQAVRQYEAASHGRRTAGWRRPATSADAENAWAARTLRFSARDLERNNKYAASMIRQFAATAWADGIAPQFHHKAKTVRQKAQDSWDRWAESKVDGQDDFYGVGKPLTRRLVTDGEALIGWRADKDGPDGRIRGMEADYLDDSRLSEATTDGGRIVQGVQTDASGDRSAYWLFDHHPGDILLPSSRQSMPVPAEHIDHVYERLRFDQARGVSWFAPLALTLRDIGDIEDAVRLQRKVQACLAMIITPGDGNAASPLTSEQHDQAEGKPSLENMRPGMVVRLKPGETASSVIPTSTGDGVDFIRQQLAAVCANMVPYYLATGDTIGATYTSLRAANLGSHALLDDVQKNVLIPRYVRPAIDRRIRRAVLETGDRRLLDCGISYALPIRRVVDPVKDLMAELIEIRAGLKTLSKALAERGLNPEEHLRSIAEMNDLIDLLKLALDSDPRRLTDAGVLQLAAAAGGIAAGATTSAN